MSRGSRPTAAQACFHVRRNQPYSRGAGTAADGVHGVKVLSLFPGNAALGEDTHVGSVLLFESQRGAPVALLDAASLTAIRTAAVSAVATRLLAREDAGDLALLGAGVQAHTHLEALLHVRPLRRVRVWSRDPERARRFARTASGRHHLPVTPAATARQAVEGADLVCTLTGASEPVLEGGWLAPGAHVNAVGACTPNARELDTDAVRRSRLFVDRPIVAIVNSHWHLDHSSGNRVGGEQRIDFAPGTTWVVYSDQVLHAAMSGQHMMEQTFYLQVERRMEDLLLRGRYKAGDRIPPEAELVEDM